MKQIPNIFTLFNLFFGCLAILCALQNGIVIRDTFEGAQLVDVSERFWMSSVFIGCAAVVDFLDGFVARWLKATSDLGKQLDSLADVVSFGVAPSMIIYQFLRLSFATQEDGLNISIIFLTPAFFFAMAAAYRLGKFNIDPEQSYHFKGLPTPAAGLFIAGLPLIYWHATQSYVYAILLNKWFLYSIILLMCYLMVSNIPLLALKFDKGNTKKLMPFILMAIIGIVSVFILHWLAIPVIFISYIILSVVFRSNRIS